MTDAPHTHPGDDRWNPFTDDDRDPFGPPPDWPNPTFGQRVRHLRGQALFAASEAYTAAAAWAAPRWRELRETLDDHTELTSRCGNHPTDIAGQHGNEPLHRAAMRTWPAARMATAVLATIATLAGLLLTPTFARWRPYRTLQHWAGHRAPAWMDRTGHPRDVGQHAVAWLATSPFLSVLVFLFAASVVASAIHTTTVSARHGYAAAGSRIVLIAAMIAAAVGIWRPVTHATGHLFGAGAGPVGGFAAAAALGLAWQAFGATTRRQAGAVRHLNRYTAAAAMAAEVASRRAERIG